MPIFDPDKDPPALELSNPELIPVYNELTARLGKAKLELMADLSSEICDRTGYGSVNVVFNDSRCTLIKQEISHK